MATNGSTTRTQGGGGNGWPRRWWERAFAAILILIAIVAAILLYVYFNSNSGGSYPPSGGGDDCPWWNRNCHDSGDTGLDPSISLAVWHRFTSYGASTEVFDVEAAPGANVHERYMWYQPPYSSYSSYPQAGQGNYFFLAFQWGQSYGASARESAPRLELSVLQRFPGPVNQGWNNANCRGPIRLQPSASAANAEPTWYYWCRIPSQGYASNGAPGGTGAYRVFITNNSDLPIHYTYFATCSRRYPRGDACPTPESELNPQQGPGYPPSTGYPSSGYPSSGYPAPSSGYPSSGYPSSGYPSSGYPSSGGSYPSSPPAYSPPYPSSTSPSSSYPSAPSTPMSSPPPKPATGSTGSPGSTDTGGPSH